VNRRAKNVKNVLTQERERERAGRERVWRAREERIHVDAEGGEEIAEEDVITCERELWTSNDMVLTWLVQTRRSRLPHLFYHRGNTVISLVLR
jgi:hypothetical protein